MKDLTSQLVEYLNGVEINEENIVEVADTIVTHTRNACAHTAGFVYIDCEPEQQEVVDMVQQQIIEAIMGEIN